jgi:hypothetical protein
MDDEQTPSDNRPGAGLLSRAAGIIASARQSLKEITAGLAYYSSTLTTGLGKSFARQTIAPVSAGAPGPSNVTEAALASITEVRQSIRPELPGGIIALIPTIIISLLVVALAIGALYALNFASFFYFAAVGRPPF